MNVQHESCVTVCPTHIDIRKGLQLECINCLECVMLVLKLWENLENHLLFNGQVQIQLLNNLPTKC